MVASGDLGEGAIGGGGATEEEEEDGRLCDGPVERRGVLDSESRSKVTNVGLRLDPARERPSVGPKRRDDSNVRPIIVFLCFLNESNGRFVRYVFL